MGTTYVTMKVRKNKQATESVELEFLVDSGAAFSMAPARVLRGLGIEPDEKRDFILANGEKITRQVGEAYFQFGEHAGTSKVIFGEEADGILLGNITLETFGLMLDPFKRTLRPLPTPLM